MGTNKINVQLKAKYAINLTKDHFANKCRPSNRSKVKVNQNTGCCREEQLQQSDQNKVQEQPYPGQSPCIGVAGAWHN